MVTGERRRRDARVDGLRWALIAAVSGIHFGVVACSGKSSKDSSGGSGDGGTSGTSAGQGGTDAGTAGAGKGGSGGAMAGGGDAGQMARGGTGGAAGAPHVDGGTGALSGGGGGGQGGSTSKGGSSGTGDPGGSGNDGGGPNPFPCSSSESWYSTLESCDGAFVHRPAAAACPLPEHDSSVIGGEGGAPSNPGTLPCVKDADCDGGYCVLGQPGGYCIYPCTDDASCPTQTVCVCDAYTQALGTMPLEAGRCVPAECTTDADCAPGFACAAPLDSGSGCPQSPTHFACQTPSDECGGKGHCTSDEICSGSSPRTCELAPSCGRPFLVAGLARSAPSVAGAAWVDTALSSAPLGDLEREGTSAPVEALDAAARGVIAEHWLEAGAMEHASVAAFARFALELMSLGAPARLVEATTRAMADETRHARLCYGLAARYSGDARGPGPLDVTGALADNGLLSVVERAVLEGCIGETQAAVEAAWAAESATDPVVRDVLERIAEDETRHAALAFDFVAWASKHDATVRALVERTFALARAQADAETRRARSAAASVRGATARASGATLAAHGVLDEATRCDARRAALFDVLPSVWSAAAQGAESGQRAETGPPAREAHA